MALLDRRFQAWAGSMNLLIAVFMRATWSASYFQLPGIPENPKPRRNPMTREAILDNLPPIRGLFLNLDSAKWYQCGSCVRISSSPRETRSPPFAGMAQVPQARGALAREWIINGRARLYVWKGTDATQNAKEMRVRVMATTTKGSPCVLFRGTSVSRRLTSMHPSRLASTWPTRLVACACWVGSVRGRV